MRFAVKVLISLCVIVCCSQIAKKMPSLAGLISVMPLTGCLVLVWVYMDSPGDFERMTDYCRGALWGIIPSILFFVVAFICFRKHLSLWIVLCASFAVWVAGAAVHQLLLHKPT
ncbi:MAG: DUF3147 family protein [Planctomycetes bacterium]|nr:DUF3147 family protein [Planctomycetota bacterium]